ncbi:dTDP-4-amino-4,6-dideoxygalactose transaminase [Halobiforma haloterrestris]|uniref:dTDP-4-amino-4,6-dideoxygalactose transaminase n=1 Tax=Natronobacterium haloterrestre TaxID=148448 RepID=A0A1I1F3W7_NATHA|nr:DegT/DnrJ/EryC1/StrS family aminotransferase [Halobiforma haloterrestris]SFB94075.1 dTDP-4-amino-4,6-dideoxygalactose transaminase [Halobiforma haloterrestris]
MIDDVPSLTVEALSRRRHGRPAGLDSFFDRHARAFTYYGSGKVALRDGLAGVLEAGQNVLLPAYLPDGVVEPLYELGLEPRYYAVRSTLAPDFADIEGRADGNTGAVVSVDYFGFPQPGLEEVAAIAADRGWYHVDDNAHAPISRSEGRLLGTLGDLGITSLWKLLPVPNGAILYLTGDDVREGYDPSDLAGVRDGLGAADCRFVLKSFVGDLLESNAMLRHSVEAILAERGDGDAPAVGGPKARYERAKVRMSKLSMRIVEDSDPEKIRTARRANYRAWLDVLGGRADLEPVYDSLPRGICPQAFPVRAARPDAFLAELETAGIGAHTWPRLSDEVLEDPEYETATRLSREIVTLPVHQEIEPGRIAALGDRLRR